MFWVNIGVKAALIALLRATRPISTTRSTGGTISTFIRGSPELATAYTDTLSDLGLGLSGSVVAALVTVTLVWPRRRRLDR